MAGRGVPAIVSKATTLRTNKRLPRCLITPPPVSHHASLRRVWAAHTREAPAIPEQKKTLRRQRPSRTPDLQLASAAQAVSATASTVFSANLIPRPAATTASRQPLALPWRNLVVRSFCGRHQPTGPRCGAPARLPHRGTWRSCCFDHSRCPPLPPRRPCTLLDASGQQRTARSEVLATFDQQKGLPIIAALDQQNGRLHRSARPLAQ
eukprot:355404-Chlamydomonas_euryale.AAC.2